MKAYWDPNDVGMLIIDFEGICQVRVRPPPEGMTPTWIQKFCQNVAEVCAPSLVRHSSSGN
jgi:hypothetical protein